MANSNLVDESSAIRFENVNKSYKLYPSALTMAVDALGLSVFVPKVKSLPVHHALKDISVDIKKGERIGIIGRNGAGKSTLLKLITENFKPTSGDVTVNGKVQSLMDSGVGFHPEFTGLENIRSSLMYNGLASDQIQEAIDDIIDFCELGEFINQPIKTYSLGMLARLGFATATAIKPEILIIDEILGAGDGYFSLKSVDRIKRLTSDGTTLLLVSHSLQQILQFCTKTIWLHQGQIVEYGESLEVVKKYDKYIRSLDEERLKKINAKTFEVGAQVEDTIAEVSRWDASNELVITKVSFKDALLNESQVFNTGDELNVQIEFSSTVEQKLATTVVVFIYTVDGTPLILTLSDEITVGSKEKVKKILSYPKLSLGNGEFVVSVALYKNINLDDLSSATYFDLIDRSFRFKVYNKHKQDNSLLTIDTKWTSF